MFDLECMEDRRISEKTVAATVVLYNSDQQILKNIDTYIHQVDKLYVIDNSERVDTALVELLRSRVNIMYYWMEGNQGIAAALNKAAELAIGADYRYLLMLDDDSQLISETTESMLSYVARHSSNRRIGIVTAQADPNLRGTTAESVWYSITSGSLLDLKAYQECGPFMEELFIDGVDHEYCYRLKQCNYEIVILNYLPMLHRMGTQEEVKLFNKILFRWSSHSPLRSYYLVRNFMFILNKYNVLLPNKVKREVYYGVIKACLLDLLLGRQKRLRWQYTKKALFDYRNHRLGKFA